MTSYTQDNRSASVSTPLGKDKLLLKSMVGQEAISRPFNYKVEMLSEDDDIEFEKLLGEKLTIRLDHMEDGQRFFNGLIADLEQNYSETGWCHYYAQVVPWFWFLKKSSNCRIFRHKTVPEILLKLFKIHGFEDFETRLSGTYPTLEHCVQYRETDFAFASRLMEEVGIYYFFTHEDGKHTMVLCDSKAAREPCPDFNTIKCVHQGRDQGMLIPNGMSHWEQRKQVVPGAFSLTDFNFTKPLKKFASEVTDQKHHLHSDFEQYVYEGEYIEDGGIEPSSAAEFTELAKIRLAALQAEYSVAYADSDCRGLQVGHIFELTDCLREDQNRGYFITEISHQIEMDDYATTSSGSVGTNRLYSCRISVISDEVEYRPARLTPKPRVSGPQTATVVGMKEEEIETDKYGRVKVQFHWDRDKDRDEAEDVEGKKPEHRSCWVRVSQNWAGKKWGAFFLPRIGQEVIIAFLEGDPDRPIILGSVYNGDHMPPYDLPTHKTMSTIKSHSSKGGMGFNEIRFEDKKNAEQIFVHAQKNQDTRVVNDCFEWIGNSRHLIVKTDQFEHVENNRSEKVDADHIEEIGKDRHLNVKGKEAKEVTGSHSMTVKGDVIEVFKSNHSEQTTGDYYLKAGGVVIEASTGITLKVGGNSVVIDPSGVTVKGSLVTLDSSMCKINSGPGASPASGSAGSAVLPTAPDSPEEADIADPGTTGRHDAESESPFKPSNEAEDEEEKKSWIEIELVDEEDNPVPGEKYKIELPDGTVATGTLDEKGFARVEGFDPGQCKVTFPELDKDAWDKA